MTDITASIIVIGDEILSGRTKDKNIGYIAELLTKIGLNVMEVRVVPDKEEKIINTLNQLRKEYTYVLTTGGIGPTHDDITADCVAKAFNVEISENNEAIKMLLERIPLKDLNDSRRRMARIPHGAKLIENSVSKAPGFQIGNVFVMAGVPTVMQAMLDVIIKRMETGQKLFSCNILTDIKEGDIADILRSIQGRTETVSIGSYPYYNDNGYGANIVCRGKNIDELKSIASIIKNDLSEIGNVEIGEIL
jgi:molybdenum cofactor synthesis domain-containing protein